MVRFVAFCWSAGDPIACGSAVRLTRVLHQQNGRWEQLLRSEGIGVYAAFSADEPVLSYQLPGEAGVVLGRLFPTDSGSLNSNGRPKFQPADAVAILGTAGRALVERYWGAYVAFLHDRPHDTCYVVRDCSGQVPCYVMRQDRVEVTFADIADVLPLKGEPFTLDAAYLAAFVHDPDLQVRRCALTEVSELLAGEALAIRGASTRRYLIWDPRRICRGQAFEDAGQAAALLRRTTQLCINAWSSAHHTILLRLSGGLDSAIVLGCLKKARRRATLTCLNLFGDNPREDERWYARLAASRAGATLLEEPLLSATHRFESPLDGALMAPKPSIVSLWLATINDATDRSAATIKATAVWTGEGGDHLFLDDRTCLPAADYLTCRGLRPGWLSAVSSAADLSRNPYISVLRTAWQLARSTAPWRPSQPALHGISFVNPEALPEDLSSYTAHPWRSDVAALPMGKQAQLYFLADVLHRHRPLPHIQRVPLCHPLLSQPLIELCLSIPSYVLVHGGRQRALARKAFRDQIPEEIFQRQDKGSSSFAAMELFRRSQPFIRETLLGGVLVGRRIIDPEVLQPYLEQAVPIRDEQARSLLACLAAELWARLWTSSGIRASPRSP